VCKIKLFKNNLTSTSSKSFAAKIQSTSGKPQHNIGYAISAQYPQCCHSDEEHRARLDYMLDLEETMRQVGFVNVCSILTDPRHRTVTATVPYWIEVTKPLKFSRSKHFTKQNLVCLTGLPLKNQIICISVHAANNRLKNGCILTFECLIARSC